MPCSDSDNEAISRTPSIPEPPTPTFQATPIPLPILHDPPPITALPVPDHPGLHVTANLIAPELFAPWLGNFYQFIRTMVELHPPHVPLPPPIEISAYLAANAYAIALSDAYAVGYILFTLPDVDPFSPSAPPLTINLIHVHPAHRRRGAGTALVREVACLGVRRGVASLQAYTQATPELMAFWQDSAFVKDDNTRRMHDGRYAKLRVSRTARSVVSLRRRT